MSGKTGGVLLFSPEASGSALAERTPCCKRTSVIDRRLVRGSPRLGRCQFVESRGRQTVKSDQTTEAVANDNGAHAVVPHAGFLGFADLKLAKLCEHLSDVALGYPFGRIATIQDGGHVEMIDRDRFASPSRVYPHDAPRMHLRV